LGPESQSGDWSAKFSNPGVESRSPQKQGLHIPALPWLPLIALKNLAYDNLRLGLGTVLERFYVC